MNQEEKESALHFLNSLKWPKDKLGYLMSDESDLPPYRILSKMLKEKNIDQKMTWNKAQCIEALGGIENVQEYMQKEQNFISDNLASLLMNEIIQQKELSENIEQFMQGSSDTLLQIMQNEENSHIEQQQQMFS